MTARNYYSGDGVWNWEKEREFQDALEEMATKVANAQEIIELPEKFGRDVRDVTDDFLSYGYQYDVRNVDLEEEEPQNDFLTKLEDFIASYNGTRKRDFWEISEEEEESDDDAEDLCVARPPVQQGMLSDEDSDAPMEEEEEVSVLLMWQCLEASPTPCRARLTESQPLYSYSF